MPGVRLEFFRFTWGVEAMFEVVGLEVVEANFPAPLYGEFIAHAPG